MDETIGIREIKKGIEKGTVKKVLVASNCPQNLIDQLKKLNVTIEEFDGDQENLGTKIGKPFPVAMVGLKD